MATRLYRAALLLSDAAAEEAVRVSTEFLPFQSKPPYLLGSGTPRLLPHVTAFAVMLDDDDLDGVVADLEEGLQEWIGYHGLIPLSFGQVIRASDPAWIFWDIPTHEHHGLIHFQRWLTEMLAGWRNGVVFCEQFRSEAGRRAWHDFGWAGAGEAWEPHVTLATLEQPEILREMPEILQIETSAVGLVLAKDQPRGAVLEGEWVYKREF